MVRSQPIIRILPPRIFAAFRRRPAQQPRITASRLAHGTYVAGILAARRGSGAPAICPGCTLLVRPIFLETASDNAEMPSATPGRGRRRGRRVRRCGRAGRQPERRRRIAVAQQREKAGRSAELRGPPRRDRRRGGGQPGHHRQLGHHPPCVGYPRRGVRPSRTTDRPLEPGRLDRPARTARAGRSRHQPRDARRTGHVRRNERCGSVRHGNRRAVVVGVSDRNSNRDQARHHPSRPSGTQDDRAAFAQRVGGVPGDGVQSFQEDDSMTEKTSAETNRPASTRAILTGFISRGSSATRTSAWVTS